MKEIFTIGSDSTREISGVICTLNRQYADPATGRGRVYVRTLERLRSDEAASIAIPFPYRLKFDILNVYLCMAQRIVVGLAFSHAEPGDSRETFGGRMVKPGWWLVCTGPVSHPRDGLMRNELPRGRYTQALW